MDTAIQIRWQLGPFCNRCQIAVAHKSGGRNGRRRSLWYIGLKAFQFKQYCMPLCLDLQDGMLDLVLALSKCVLDCGSGLFHFC